MATSPSDAAAGTSEQLLARVPLFSGLPLHELQYLTTHLQTVTLADGAILMREGDYGDHFYIILEGQVEVVKALGTDDERLVGVRGTCEFVGEMSLLSMQGQRTASVRAKGPARLWEMARADFDALLHRQPLLAYEMVRVLSRRLTASHNRAMDDLHEKNRQLTQAYAELQAAQAQLIEKEKLERELQLAHEIQMGLLPAAVPRLAGLEIGARLVPARAVGGDWYDFIPLDGDTLGLVVGDVTDKGVPAALFMAQTRALLRAEAMRSASPREALERVNRHLLEKNTAGYFVTVVYGVLDRRTRTFAYVRAGHEPPLVCGPGPTGEFVPHADGQPLGVLQAPLLDEQRVSIPPGGFLLLYTDGVTDARDERRTPFGEERLAAGVCAPPGRSAQQVCDDLLQEVLTHHGAAAQYDDITIVVVRSEG